MNKFTWEKLEKPFFVMAPMAGITDRPFRKIVKMQGADLVYSEMIASDALFFKSKKTEKLMEFDPEERPYIVQIFGNVPEKMAYAARFITENLKPDGIDINMGCPAKKVVGSGKGSALLQDFDLALKNIEAVRATTRLPLSVKMRLGWDEFEIIDFVKDIEKCGVDAITIHARTKKQGFKGVPNWSAIGAIKEALNIPVIGNGSVLSLDDSKKMLEITSCDGVMIGRGALGNPWIFRSLKEKVDFSPDLEEIKKVVILHTKLNIEEYGEPKGILNMRKHYGWYFRGFPEISLLRNKLIRVSTFDEVFELLNFSKRDGRQVGT